MKSNKKLGLYAGLFLFAVGLIIGLVFNGLAVWGDLEGMSFWGYPESISFDSSLTAEARISKLKCPVMITPGETGTIKTTISNPNDFAIKPWVQVHLSMPGVPENMVRQKQEIALEPGEKRELSWEVTTENTIHNRAVMARVYLLLTELHPPARTQHCGIISAKLGNLTGVQLLGGTISLSLTLLASGTYIWWRSSTVTMKRENRVLKFMLWLSAMMIVCTLTSLLGFWVLGLIILILALLLLISTLDYLLISK